MNDPVYYIYRLPDDYEIRPEDRLKLDNFARKYGLSNEAMQEAVNLHVELTEDFVTRFTAYLKTKATQLGLIIFVVGLALYLIF